MENLHTDILDNILSRLPDESTLQCKLVCKTWRSLLGDKTKSGLLYCELFDFSMDDLRFQFHYGKNSSHLPDYTKINIKKLRHGNFKWKRTTSAFTVGSCNGLVCVEELHEYKSLRSRQVISICNPVTGETVRLPGSRKLNLLKEDSAVGFGYIPITNEYKIVRIHYTMPQKEGHVQVYTLGSNLGWRDVGRIPFCLPSFEDFANKVPFPFFGVFANGSVYWLVKQEGVQYNILAFDLANEKFTIVSSPLIDEHVLPRLLLLGEDLCLVLKDTRCSCIDILVFKKNISNAITCEAKQNRLENYDHQQEDYSSAWSWRKEFNIPCDIVMNYEPFTITKNNEVLLWHRKQFRQQICCYNPKNSLLEKLGDCKYFRAIPHINSLTSLKALGECSRFRKLSSFFERCKNILRLPLN